MVWLPVYRLSKMIASSQHRGVLRAGTEPTLTLVPRMAWLCIRPLSIAGRTQPSGLTFGRRTSSGAAAVLIAK